MKIPLNLDKTDISKAKDEAQRELREQIFKDEVERQKQILIKKRDSKKWYHSIFPYKINVSITRR